MVKGYPVYIQVGSGIYLELYGVNKDIPGIDNIMNIFS